MIIRRAIELTTFSTACARVDQGVPDYLDDPLLVSFRQ
jgi:hypothetical protein